MSIVTPFTFNAFQENTYIIYDTASLEAVIIDPGCYTQEERDQITNFISSEKLKIEAILNTHCHVDHVFGNAYAKRTFPGAPLCIHQGEHMVLKTYPQFAAMYGLAAEPSPEPDRFLQTNEVLTIGDIDLKVLFTPGHSPASVSFYCEADKYIISGDVLFHNSIGRTDLPGGDFNTLISSIRTQLFTLPDNVVVYSGHGPSTTIGHEKRNNPFLNHS